MSGDLKVDGDFNVFDSWGNNVGKLTPSGGGEGFLIGLVLTIVVISVVFMAKGVVFLGRMTMKGLEALEKREWGNAFAHLWPAAAILAYLIAFTFYQGAVEASARSNAAREKLVAPNSEPMATPNPELERMRQSVTAKFVGPIGDDSAYVVINHGSETVLVYTPWGTVLPDEAGMTYPGKRLNPGEYIIVRYNARGFACINIRSVRGWPGYSICPNE